MSKRYNNNDNYEKTKYKYKNYSDKRNDFSNESNKPHSYLNVSNEYACVEQDNNINSPFRSVEGYIIFVSGIHPEASEDHIYDLFTEYGTIKNIHINMDRNTGFLKGYALLEFEHLNEAEKVVKNLNGKIFYGRNLVVSYAFKRKELRKV
jgi:RNA-binding protein 8A